MPWVVIVLLGFYSQTVNAKTTTADFLKWNPNQQESFLQIAISMTGVIASQSKPDIAQCLDQWYFVDDETRRQRNQEILDMMPEFDTFAPTVVVLAIVNDVCGEL